MVRCHKNSSLCSRLFLVGVNRHVISALINFQKSKMAAKFEDKVSFSNMTVNLDYNKDSFFQDYNGPKF